MKNSILPVFVLLLAVGQLGGCKHQEQESPQPEPGAGSASTAERRATRVEVAVIKASAAKLELTRPGEVEASREAKLAAPLGGFIENVSVKEGARVHKGQVLALVDSATHQARRRQAKVELDAAKRELKRAKRVRKVLPEIQYDNAKTRVRAAKAALRTADVMVSRTVVRAPFSGVIDAVNVEAGEVAPPGAPMFRLLKLHPVIVNVSVSDRDVLSVSKGMAALITTDARGAQLTGKVKRIHRAADVKTRAFAVEVEVDNKKERLLPGMIATVRLQSKVADQRVVIANDWLVTKTDGLGVFVLDKGEAHYRSVKLGPIVGNRVVIESGLKVGDELVITGHRELANGDALLVARRGVCCREGRVVFDGK